MHFKETVSILSLKYELNQIKNGKFCFLTLNFDDSPFLSQSTYERDIYLKKKALCTSK